MNTLPVATRELRVAARRRSTFWLRVVSALAGILIGSAFLSVTQFQGVPVASIGRALFSTLSWICMGAALAAGLFFTSDCISQERREGTLGLLFLTRLRGYDVVAGKLFATSLRGFYALLAVLPVLAIAQLLGGITGSEYVRTALALVNALFLSLAAGMVVSSQNRQSQTAMMATLLLLLILTFGGPIADSVIAAVRRTGFKPFWSFSSPGYLLVTAGAMARHDYWTAFGTTHALGWLFLAAACGLTRRSSREKVRGSRVASAFGYSWRYGRPGPRARFRRKMLDFDPVAWLLSREIWSARSVWILVGLVLAGVVVTLALAPPRPAWVVWNYLGGLFALLLYLWAATQACRFFVEARRGGLLELLLSSPVNERQIIAAQWRAWKRMFALPVLLLIAVHVGGIVLAQLSFQWLATTMATAVPPAAAVTNRTGTTNMIVTSGTVTVRVAPTGGTSVRSTSSPSPSSSSIGPVLQATVAGASASIITISNIIALLWFGMWMGLTSRTANLATLKTLLFVQVIPWFAIWFISNMAVGLVFAGYMIRKSGSQPAMLLTLMPFLSSISGAILGLAKNVAFIAWSRKNLRTSLRARASVVSLEPVAQSRPRPAPSRVPPPLPQPQT